MSYVLGIMLHAYVIILAYEVARALEARTMFGDKQGNETILHPGSNIKPRDRVVDDILTVGGSVRQLIDLTHQEPTHSLPSSYLRSLFS